MTIRNKISKSIFRKAVSVLIVICMMCAVALPLMTFTASAVEGENRLVIDTAGGANYSLFNSGRTGSGYEYSSTSNPDDSSYTNSGYDLYANQGCANDTIQLGLPFLISTEINEVVHLNIYAYDVDEVGNYGSCNERDYIYLVDETSNTRTQLSGYLTGQDQTWNNTEFSISEENFVVGHTYHFELNVDCSAGCTSDWVVYVRTVNITVNGSSEPPVAPTTGIENADLSASISTSGLVTVDLFAKAYAEEDYILEYKAVCVADNAQYGGKEYAVTIPTVSNEFYATFQLESAATRGTYRITVFIKDGAGNVIATRTATASYGYSAVSYNSNGGSQNIPMDGTTYSSGDTVTVRFDSVPSMYGYTFLGWSTDRYATVPEYTANGNNTFTIYESDVTLYAVWEKDDAPIVNPQKNGKVLLIEDILPWGSNANAVTLQKLVDDGKIEGYDKYSSALLANGTVNMNDYAMVVLAADQEQSFYNNIPVDGLASYAQNGGSVFLAADTSGHSSGKYYSFPFGITSTRSGCDNNYIVDPTHPMITGIYSDGRVLQNSNMYGSSISHNYFTNYPVNTNVILQDGSQRATLIEFEYGNGLVVVSGLTFECAYSSSWDFFAGYDDIFVHLYNQGGNNINNHSHEFTETSRTEATCTTDGRIEYGCSCGASRYEIIEAYGHSIETVIEAQVTCTTDGLIVDRCLNNGCDYEKRTVIHGSHDYKITDSLEATCNTEGYIEYTCSNCEDMYYEYFEGKHNYVETSRVEPQVEVEGGIIYTCTECQDSYSIALPALMPVLKNSAVLLIQNSLPWAENVNMSLLETLKDRGVVSYYNIINTSALATTDLTQYGVIMIANDQSSSMYSGLSANSEALENYVRAGGNLIYGACDQGWGGSGSLTHALPGGVTTSNYYSVHNYIVNELHPIITGVYTDNRSLRDELLKGNYCSHTYFDKSSLPEDTNVILRDANGNPTLVEYALGDGTVIASGLTWEYFYVRDHYNMVTNYSKYAYDDLLTYMVYMSSTCEHDYEMVETVDPTCEESGYTKYVCTLCSHEYKGDIVAATSHTHSDWIIDLYPTANQAGSKYKECTVCYTILETEVIPSSAKLVISKVEAGQGSTVRVTVDIQNNPGIIGALLTLSYDPALTLVNVEAGSAWNSLNFTGPATLDAPCNFIWDGVGVADHSDGSIIVLTFELPEDSYIGAVYNISASYTQGNMINADLEPVDLAIEDGYITVIDPVGDVNNDGISDVADVIVLRRYLAGGYNVEIDETAADMDQDGYITVADLVLLRRFLVI